MCNGGSTYLRWSCTKYPENIYFQFWNQGSVQCGLLLPPLVWRVRKRAQRYQVLHVSSFLSVWKMTLLFLSCSLFSLVICRDRIWFSCKSNLQYFYNLKQQHFMYFIILSLVKNGLSEYCNYKYLKSLCTIYFREHLFKKYSWDILLVK